MLKEFIETITTLSDEEHIEIDGHNYYKQGYRRYTPPEVEKITINTLQGFCDFVPTIKKQGDLFIVVDSPEQVRLISDIDDKYKHRNTYCIAQLNSQRLDFSWKNSEDFNVFLQANFEHTKDKDSILELIGNVSDEEIKNYSDDGITQTTTKKTGLSRKENAKVPNPVYLAPYRTFIDIDQPESMFIFRMQSSGIPQCKLFLADGELWKVRAINMIKEYLNEKIKDIPIIG